MRLIWRCAIVLAVACPFASAVPAARAEEPNGLLGQAQRLLNGGNERRDDAYERGREDEHRRQEAERRREHERREYRSDQRDVDRDSYPDRR